MVVREMEQMLLDIFWASTVALPLNLPAASLLGLLGLEGVLV